MNEVAIRADKLSKRFVLHTQKRTALKERIVRGRPPKTRELWALREASFDVRRGEAFGIIGHNGAGKSTALKVLTGVYRPTHGSVSVNGRVSALLELGAGFHPELTGRENIRLNGSILGLGRKQIDSMMDEIIDFSGVESFIDAPVKVYSSGMFVRLGFAIAVKLDPEILIMDEVIAVGDEQFQRKCYDYLYGLRQDGCTIVIVSHSMGSIQQLCDRAVWLDHGAVAAIGSAYEVTQKYLDSVNAAEVLERRGGEEAVEDYDDSPGTGEVRVTGVEFLTAHGEPADVLMSRDPVTLRMHYVARTSLPKVTFGFMIHNESGVVLVAKNTTGQVDPAVEEGEGHLDYDIEDLLLLEGTYQVSTLAHAHSHIFDAKTRRYHVKVRSTDSTSGGSLVLPGTWSATS
jgi:ABC-2 type transport system ATP-binding protein/lipopolysaccharide transport system ATP-binding protein